MLAVGALATIARAYLLLFSLCEAGKHAAALALYKERAALANAPLASERSALGALHWSMVAARGSLSCFTSYAPCSSRRVGIVRIIARGRSLRGIFAVCCVMSNSLLNLQNENQLFPPLHC